MKNAFVKLWSIILKRLAHSTIKGSSLENFRSFTTIFCCLINEYGHHTNHRSNIFYSLHLVSMVWLHFSHISKKNYVRLRCLYRRTDLVAKRKLAIDCVLGDLHRHVLEVSAYGKHQLKVQSKFELKDKLRYPAVLSFLISCPGKYHCFGVVPFVRIIFCHELRLAVILFLLVHIW